MRTHDDRPGGGGGYFDDQQSPAGADRTQRVQPADPPAGPPSAGGPAGSTQHLAAPTASGADDVDYYDDYDDAYSDEYRDDRYGAFDEDFFDEARADGRRAFAWNGGTDLGLVILRLVLGGVVAAHGAQKLFGVLGGPGPDGFARYLQKAGFEHSAVLSLVTGVTELGGGILLVVGLFTPLAAAGVLGVMANAVVVKLDNGFFASQGGVEYEIVLGALALGLLFTGPGRAALDNGRSWFRHPLASGFIGLVVAAGASAAVLLTLR